MYSVRPPLLFSGLTPDPQFKPLMPKVSSRPTWPRAAIAAPAEHRHRQAGATPRSRGRPRRSPPTHFAASPSSRRPSAMPAPCTPPPKALHAATRPPSVIAPPPTSAPSAASRPDSRQARAVASVTSGLEGGRALRQPPAGGDGVQHARDPGEVTEAADHESGSAKPRKYRTAPDGRQPPEAPEIRHLAGVNASPARLARIARNLSAGRRSVRSEAVATSSSVLAAGSSKPRRLVASGLRLLWRACPARLTSSSACRYPSSCLRTLPPPCRPIRSGSDADGSSSRCRRPPRPSRSPARSR